MNREAYTLGEIPSAFLKSVINALRDENPESDPIAYEGNFICLAILNEGFCMIDSPLVPEIIKALFFYLPEIVCKMMSRYIYLF